MSITVRLVALAVAAAVAVLPATAKAAFLSTADLGPAVADTNGLQLVADADGSATLAFNRGAAVQVATKQPGEVFSLPVTLGSGGAVRLWSAPGQRTLALWTKDGYPWFAVREHGAA